MYSLIKAVGAVFCSVAELVEVDALSRADALYVVERTSHDHLCRTYRRGKKKKTFFQPLEVSSSLSRLVISYVDEMDFDKLHHSE